MPEIAEDKKEYWLCINVQPCHVNEDLDIVYMEHGIFEKPSKGPFLRMSMFIETDLADFNPQLVVDYKANVMNLPMQTRLLIAAPNNLGQPIIRQTAPLTENNIVIVNDRSDNFGFAETQTLKKQAFEAFDRLYNNSSYDDGMANDCPSDGARYILMARQIAFDQKLVE